MQRVAISLLTAALLIATTTLPAFSESVEAKTIHLRAQVVRFTPNAFIDHYDDNSSQTFGATGFIVCSPQAYRGRQFSLYSEQRPPALSDGKQYDFEMPMESFQSALQTKTSVKIFIGAAIGGFREAASNVKDCLTEG